MKPCPFCSKQFNGRKGQVYCSLSCASQYGWSITKKPRKEIIVKPCENCGTMLETSPDRIRDGRGKCCSRKCWYERMAVLNKGRVTSEKTKEILSTMRIGSLNPAYKHGQSFGTKKYEGSFPRRLKDKVKERDGYKCAECSSTDLLVVHHIDHDPLNNNLDNLITWCASCHATHHRTHEYANGLR